MAENAQRRGWRARTIRQSGAAWLLTLDGRWEPCVVDVGHGGRSLTVQDDREAIAPGTSGSPILTEDGRAVGIVSVRSERNGPPMVELRRQPWLANTCRAGCSTNCWRNAAKRQHDGAGYVYTDSEDQWARRDGHADGGITLWERDEAAPEA